MARLERRIRPKKLVPPGNVVVRTRLTAVIGKGTHTDLTEL